MSRASAAKIAANRANARRSTGPRTPEGKARSSQNARKHNFPVVRLDEIDELDRLRARAIAAYKPVNSQESLAVERIALAQQALLRAERLHSAIFAMCLNQAPTAVSPLLVDDAGNRDYLLAVAFQRLVAESPAFMQFLRYQARAERPYRRAVEEFECVGHERQRVGRRG